MIALRIPELGCEMLKLISGNDRAKHAALWEGPFEYYVWLAGKLQRRFQRAARKLV